jgi:hypothetical protein
VAPRPWGHSLGPQFSRQRFEMSADLAPLDVVRVRPCSVAVPLGTRNMDGWRQPVQSSEEYATIEERGQPLRSRFTS